MATQIKVLLKNDVPSLGTGGEIVRVRPGFARNFLLPRGLAVPATAGNLARAAHSATVPDKSDPHPVPCAPSGRCDAGRQQDTDYVVAVQ